MLHIIKVKVVMALGLIILLASVPPGYAIDFTYVGESSGWTTPYQWQYIDEYGHYKTDEKFPQGPLDTAIIPGDLQHWREVTVDQDMSVKSLTIEKYSSLLGGGHHFVSSNIDNYGSISAINGIFVLTGDKIYNKTSESGLITRGSGHTLRLFSCEVFDGIVDPKGGAVEFFDSSLNGVIFKGSTSRILLGSPTGTRLLGSNTIDENASLEARGDLKLAGNQPILTNQGNIILKSNDFGELHGAGRLITGMAGIEASLKGSGILTMEKNTSIEVQTGILTNGADHTIQGLGTITGSKDNEGRIVGRLENQGTIEATGDLLDIFANVNQSGNGILKASQDGSLRLNGSTLSGGSFVPGEGHGAFLNATIKNVRLGPGGINLNEKVTFINDISIAEKTKLQFQGWGRLDLTVDTVSKKSTIANAGIIALTPPQAGMVAIMAAMGAEVTLAGSGEVLLEEGKSLMMAEGGGSFVNASGHTIRGAGFITAPLVNRGDIVAENGTLDVQGKFTQNDGNIKLRGGTFKLNGQQLTNSGTIDGYGRLKTGGLINENTLSQHSGDLEVSGNVTNNGKIYLRTGQTIFSNNDQDPKVTLTNNGTISTDYSEFKLGGNLTNTNVITISNGSFEMRGDLLNEKNGEINLKAAKPATVEGNITNNGTITVNNCNFILSNPPQGNPFVFINNGKMTVTNGVFEHEGIFQNNNVYISDPSTNTFGTLIVSQNGYLQGGQGDRFVVRGDFSNESSQNTSWNTCAARLTFTGGGNHTFHLAGKDLGVTGGMDNFAWGILELETGNTLFLEGDPGSALYVGELLGLTFGSPIVTNIFGHSLNIYYNPSLPGNEYLQGLTFELADGGHLSPSAAPLPSGILLLLSGLACLGIRGNGRKIKKS